MRTIKHILNRKSKNLATIDANETVFNALKMMAEKNIGSIIVMNGDQYLGIITERNYARQIVLQDRKSKDVLVNEIMRTDLPKFSEADKIEKCMEIMSQLNIRYIPVLENDKLVGLISMKDILDEILLHQKEVIENLTNYISN